MSLRVLTEIEVHRCCTNLLNTCAVNYESPPGHTHSLLTNLYKFTNPAGFLPQRVIKTSAGSDHSVWVTGTKADGALAYELRRHPKDRMLIKEMHPLRPHKEPRHCLLKSLFHNYRKKRIYHQRNHIFGRKTDVGICVLPNSYSKTCTN